MLKNLSYIAAIIAIGFAGIQIGTGMSSDKADMVRINIQNSLESVVSNLPGEKKENAQYVINPVIDLVEASQYTDTEDNQALKKASDDVTHALSQLSVLSYYADKSPFVPPLNTVQYLCGEEFALAYSSKFDQSLKITIKINGRTYYLTPGDLYLIKKNEFNLEITYLEYSKELDGPVINFKCNN